MHESAVYIASEMKAKKRAGRTEKKRAVHIQARLLGAAAHCIPLLRSLYLAYASGAFVVSKLLTPADRRLKVMRRNFKWKILKTSKLLKHGFVFHFISISLTTIFGYTFFFARFLWTLEAELTLSFAHICRCEHCTGLLYRFKWMEPVVLPRCACVCVLCCVHVYLCSNQTHTHIVFGVRMHENAMSSMHFSPVG